VIDTIGKRITEVRETATGKKLSQTEFGARLGVSRDVIANLETGRVEPSQVIINAICREFNVNEQWLRTGEGDPYTPIARDTEISEFFGDLMKGVEPTFKRRLVAALARLDESQWETLEKVARQLVGEEAEKENGPPE
jgi:transcriptional regulator with XRE-family HTH domain